MPIVLEDYLMLILTVPLVDQSLYMNLYKVHNFAMLHPTLHVHAQYELEGSYWSFMKDLCIHLAMTLTKKIAQIMQIY